MGIMSIYEFKKKMQKIAETKYPGEPDCQESINVLQNHKDADDLMCEVLSSLGYIEGVRIFEEMEKWYA